MKKIIILFIILCLFGCTKKEPTVEPTPTPEPIPEPAPAPTIIKEKEYVLGDGWLVYDFEFDGQVLTYKIKDKLTMKLEGEEKEDSSCNGKCTVFEKVTVNDKHLDLYEKNAVKLNDKVGHLYMYNLNDKLYLLCFYKTATYDKADCLVFDEEGNVINEWSNVALTMNTEYQNAFLITYLDDSGKEIKTVQYSANEKILEEKDF